MKRKSLHPVLPCVLLGWLYETQNTCRKIVYLSNTVKEKQWDNFTHLKLLFWQRKKDNPQTGTILSEKVIHTIIFTAQKMKFSFKDFFSKCDQIRSFLRIITLIITLTFHCKKNKVTWKVFLGYLGLDSIYKCFIHFIFNILSLPHISAMFFISVV